MTTIIPSLVEFGVTGVLLLWMYGPSYFFLFSGSIWAYTYYTKEVANKRKEHIQQQNESDKVGDLMINESMQNFLLVKSSSAENFEKARYYSLMMKYMNSYTDSQTVLARLNLGQKFITAGCMSLSLFMSSCAVLNGTLTLGDVVFLQTILGMAFVPLFNLGNLYIKFQESIVELKDVVKLLEVKRVVSELPDAAALEWKDPTIRLENVTYKIEDRYIMKNFSLEIPKGQILLITGKSGSGKSTLLNLLMRFWDPHEGRVTVGGKDIKSVTFRSLRGGISYCPQNTIFFNTSVLNNLLYSNIDKYYELTPEEEYRLKGDIGGDKVPIPAEVDQYLKSLGLSDHINGLPAGVFTSMGDQGQAFSGGERQRLSIVRTLLKDAPIKLFDEPTNGLDAFNEQLFIKTLAELKAKGKTSIIVTHNLNLSKYCDKVLYLKEGGNYEYGSHEQLTKSSEYAYKKLYETFLLNYKDQSDL